MPPIVVGTAFVLWSLGVVLAAWRRPALGRALLGTLFVAMGGINAVAAIANPSTYQDAYGERAWIPFYRDVINGFFAENARAFVLTVAVVQVAMGVALLLNGWAARPALAGMVVFLVAVTPAAPENVINLVFATGALMLLATSGGRAAPASDVTRGTSPRTAG